MLLGQGGINQVLDTYKAKATLNVFRQNNGYQDDTYQKIWDGKEDNYYVEHMLKTNSFLTTTELYNELEKFYKSLFGEKNE